ncbi:MAG TPA: condensation domain-containing protein, partial [Bacillota bacterium]|nr:condensation domain-containing protein [Bacillota bacterium]
MTTDQYMQNIIESSALFQDERNYWSGKLQDDCMVSAVPADFTRSNSKTVNETLHYLLPEAISQKLFYISNHSEQGVFILLLAGVMRLLAEYTNHDDLIIGIPMMKGKSGIKSINNGPLPIRTNIAIHQSFKDLILAMKQSVTEADQYKNYPFNKLAELLNLQLDDSRRFLFNIAAMMTNLHDRNFLAEVRADLLFSFTINQAGLEMNIEYNQGLYRSETINRLTGHFRNIFMIALENPGIKLSDIELLSEEEKIQLLSGADDSQANYPKLSIHQLFEAQAQRTPDNVAVVFQDSLVTYRELNARSNQLAK